MGQPAPAAVVDAMKGSDPMVALTIALLGLAMAIIIVGGVLVTHFVRFW